jgi:uncharacterized protein YlzI (FlbEa/FlbD family)
MAKMIKLTTHDGRACWVNADNIILMDVNGAPPMTNVFFVYGNSRNVRETPEQIARLCEPLYVAGADGSIRPLEGS